MKTSSSSFQRNIPPQQTTVVFYESTLPWFSQERRPRTYSAGIGKYLLVSNIDGTAALMAGEKPAKITMKSRKKQSKTDGTHFFARLHKFHKLEFENAGICSV